MMKAWIDLKKHAPWLGTSNIHIVADEAKELLFEELARLGFDVLQFDVGEVQNEVDFLRRIAAELKFPAYFGENWDAFHDSIGDFLILHDRPVAIVLNGVPSLFRRQPGCFIKIAFELLYAGMQAHRQEYPLEKSPSQLEVFFVGEGKGFKRKR